MGSYLPPEVLPILDEVRRRGFETMMAVGLTIDLVLSRQLSDGSYQSRPVQKVLVEYADRVARTIEGDASTVTYSEGTFSKLEPFDVLPGDTFAFGGLTGEILVALPPESGIAKASWRLRVGG